MIALTSRRLIRVAMRESPLCGRAGMYIITSSRLAYMTLYLWMHGRYTSPHLMNGTYLNC